MRLGEFDFVKYIKEHQYLYGNMGRADLYSSHNFIAH